MRYSRRDQLSLPSALEAARLDPLVHDFDNRRSALHVWPENKVARSRKRRRRVLTASQRIAALENELAMAQNELALVRSSVSWRMTHPLRRAAAFVKLSSSGRRGSSP